MTIIRIAVPNKLISVFKSDVANNKLKIFIIKAVVGIASFNWLSELDKSLLIKKRVSNANNGVVTNNPVVDKLLLKYQGREGMLDDKITKLTTKTTTRKK